MIIPFFKASKLVLTRKLSLFLITMMSLAILVHSSVSLAQTAEPSSIESVCLTVSPNVLIFDTVLVDGSTQGSLLLVNALSDTLNVRANRNSFDTIFAYPVNAFPARLSSSATDTIQVDFTPVVLGPQSSNFKLAPHNQGASCDSVQGSFRGVAIGPTADSSRYSIGGGGSHVIAISSQRDSAKRTFFFQNSTANSITIDSIAIDSLPFRKGSAFSFEPITLPVTLAAGALLPITIRFSSPGVGIQNVE